MVRESDRPAMTMLVDMGRKATKQPLLNNYVNIGIISKESDRLVYFFYGSINEH